jgi:hypothetical protein
MIDYYAFNSIFGIILFYNVALLGYVNNEFINLVFMGKLYILTVPRIISTTLFLFFAKQYPIFGYFAILYRLCQVTVRKYKLIY